MSLQGDYRAIRLFIRFYGSPSNHFMFFKKFVTKITPSLLTERQVICFKRDRGLHSLSDQISNINHTDIWYMYVNLPIKTQLKYFKKLTLPKAQLKFFKGIKYSFNSLEVYQKVKIACIFYKIHKQSGNSTLIFWFSYLHETLQTNRVGVLSFV